MALYLSPALDPEDTINFDPILAERVRKNREAERAAVEAARGSGATTYAPPGGVGPLDWLASAGSGRVPLPPQASQAAPPPMGARPVDPTNPVPRPPLRNDDDFDISAAPSIGSIGVEDDDHPIVMPNRPHIRFKLAGGDWQDQGDEIDDHLAAPYRHGDAFGEKVERTHENAPGGFVSGGGDDEAYDRYKRNLYGDATVDKENAERSIQRALAADPFAREHAQREMTAGIQSDMARIREHEAMARERSRMQFLESMANRVQSEYRHELQGIQARPDYAHSSEAKRKQMEAEIKDKYSSRLQRMQQNFALSQGRGVPSSFYAGGIETGLD